MASSNAYLAVDETLTGQLEAGDRRRLSAYDQLAKITASDGTDYFGMSVAASGDLLVVGAYRDSDGGSLSGAAFVYVTTDGGAT